MKKYIYIFSVTTASLLMTSCGSDDKKASANNTPAISVVTHNVTANDKSPFLSVSGKIQATNSADLSTRMMGYVNKVHVNVGDNSPYIQKIDSLS